MSLSTHISIFFRGVQLHIIVLFSEIYKFQLLEYYFFPHDIKHSSHFVYSQGCTSYRMHMRNWYYVRAQILRDLEILNFKQF